MAALTPNESIWLQRCTFTAGGFYSVLTRHVRVGIPIAGTSATNYFISPNEWGMLMMLTNPGGTPSGLGYRLDAACVAGADQGATVSGPTTPNNEAAAVRFAPWNVCLSAAVTYDGYARTVYRWPGPVALDYLAPWHSSRVNAWAQSKWLSHRCYLWPSFTFWPDFREVLWSSRLSEYFLPATSTLRDWLSTQQRRRLTSWGSNTPWPVGVTTKPEL